MKRFETLPGELAERFQALALPGPAWWTTRRREALERFQALGLPTSRDEAWRYSPLARLAEAPFLSEPVEASETPDTALEELGFGDFQAYRVTLVDGRFSPELSDLAEIPAGVTIAPLSRILSEQPAVLEEHLARIASDDLHAFNALNTVFAEEGLFLHLPRDTSLERPVQVVCLSRSGGRASYLRHLVLLESGARATLVESYQGLHDAPYTVSSVVEGRLGANATLRHVKDQREGQAAVHLRSARVEQERGSCWTHFDLNLGGSLVRNDVESNLHEAEAHVELDGLSTSRASQHTESFTVIDHEAPQCTSRELYKSILDGKSTGVFRGRVLVRRDAQLTDSQQQNQNLLLSQGAEIDTKPELEIYADDVKAAHGATIGQLDPDQLFFLRARGLSEEHARKLLIQAFARELLARIQVDPVREGLSAAFSASLAGVEEGKA